MRYHGSEEMFHFAMNWLSKRRVSSAQLEHQLRERFAHQKNCDSAVQQIMTRLEANGILNDRLFAESIASRYEGKGNAFIRSQLELRQFDQETIESTLESLQPEFERAVAAASSQWARYQELGEEARLQSFLRSRGFLQTCHRELKDRLGTSANNEAAARQISVSVPT